MPMRSEGKYNRKRPKRRPTLAELTALEYKRATRKANRANEKRYKQLLGVHRSSGMQARSAVGQLGQQQLADVRQNYDEAEGDIQNNLVSRGLTGSTVGATMKAGNRRERNRALNRVNEGIMAANAQVTMQAGQNLAGAIERRNDVGPDLSQMHALQAGLGAGGGANGPQSFGRPPVWSNGRPVGGVGFQIPFGLQNPRLAQQQWLAQVGGDRMRRGQIQNRRMRGAHPWVQQAPGGGGF